MPILLWALGSFVFFKVALDASFFPDVTVVASLLMGAMTTTSVYASSSFYATESGAYLARKRLGKGSGFFKPAFFVWAVTTLVDVVLAKLLVYGFSKRLNANLGGSLFFSVSEIEETLLFSAIVAAPLVLHLVMVIYATNTLARNLEKPPLSNDENTSHAPEGLKTEKRFWKISEPPWDKVTDWYSCEGTPVVVTRNHLGTFQAWSSVEPGDPWRPVNWVDVQRGACSLSKSDWKSAFEDWFDPKSGEANSNVDRSESQEQRDSPPSDNVVDRLSWDGMPVVVVRDPADGGLTAWSSVEPGDSWRTVDVLDVLSEARKLPNSDWNSRFEAWLKPLACKACG